MKKNVEFKENLVVIWMSSRLFKPFLKSPVGRGVAHFSFKRIVTPRAPSMEHKFDMDMYTGPARSIVRQRPLSSDAKIISNYKKEKNFRAAQKNNNDMAFNNPYLSVP